MIKKVGDDLPFKAQFITSKLGKTGLTVNVDVYRNGLSIVTGHAATDVGKGLYRYVLNGGTYNTVVGDYQAVFITADTTVDQREIASNWEVINEIALIDVATSSRAEPGDQMALVIGAIDAAALDPTASAELIAALLVRAITGGTVQQALENALNAALPGDAMDLITDAVDANSVAASGSAEIAAAIGSGITVTFTQTPVEIAAAVQGSRLTIQRDSDWAARLYIAGGISAARDNLIFTVKTALQKQNAAADSQSVLQISEDGGLMYINSAAGTSSKGSLTVVDESDADGNGVVDLTLDSDTAALLAPATGLTWDIKEIDAGADLARVEGLLDVVASVTRTIS